MYSLYGLLLIIIVIMLQHICKKYYLAVYCDFNKMLNVYCVL